MIILGGRIDHAHHDTATKLALTDTIEMALAVDKAVEMSNVEETLIIVTADHSHVFTIAGYPGYDEPILGKITIPSRRYIYIYHYACGTYETFLQHFLG